MDSRAYNLRLGDAVAHGGGILRVRALELIEGDAGVLVTYDDATFERFDRLKPLHVLDRERLPV